MATIFRIFAILGIVSGCPPPFNDFKYADNTTLLHEAIAQYTSNPALGWAHVIGGYSPATPWAANDEGIVVIPYCFTDEWTKSKLEKNFKEAWMRWLNKIGEPGAQTGHRLGGFREFTSKKGPELCCRDKKCKRWNMRVPVDTLEVSVTLGTPASWATMGYIPESWNNRWARHKLKIGWHNNPKLSHDHDIHTITHEMGHVFGFGHEHQRPDRDSYVKFQCENLDQYTEAVAKLVEDPSPTTTIEELCKSPMLSAEKPWTTIGFSPHEYSKEPAWDAWKKPEGEYYKYEHITGKQYDYDSIMHYSSEVGATEEVQEGRVPWTVKNVPLVR